MNLRAPRDSDAHAIAAGCSDPEVARWTRVPSPYTVEDARAWIALAAIHRNRGHELDLVIVREGEDRPLGGISLRVPDGAVRHGDIGYWVAAPVRGEGLGVRAVRLLARFGIETVGLPWIEIAVSPRNEPSRRLALSAGFEPVTVELREFKGALEEFEVFRLAAPGAAPPSPGG